MKRVITTVGTSLFINYLEQENNIKSYYSSIKEKPLSKYSEEKRRIEKIKNELLPYAKKNENSCAEITSILKLKEKFDDITIYLIATDTIDSVVACEVIEKFLMSFDILTHFDKDKDTIKFLRINKKEDFNKGINNLIDKIFQLITDSKGIIYKQNEVIFNITGGYKGIIPYFSTLAQIFNYEIAYTFEDREKYNEIIEIKPLPIEIDRGLLELYYPYLDNLQLIQNDKTKERLEETGLILNNQLTPLGKIVLKTVINTSVSKDVFGHFVEYKVYEYFITKLFNNDFSDDCLDFKYTKVLHGESLGKKLTDIDVMLQKDKDIVWIEVKPISYLVDMQKKDKLFIQIKDKQLTKWKESNYKEYNLKKYILVIYLYDEDILESIQKKTLNEFQELFNDGTDSSICYFIINLTKGDRKNNTITSSSYHANMQSLEIKKLKRIDNV